MVLSVICNLTSHDYSMILFYFVKRKKKENILNIIGNYCIRYNLCPRGIFTTNISYIAKQDQEL